MKRTATGRVVYSRPVHYFAYIDVLRIVRRVDPRTTVKDLKGSTREAVAIIGTIVASQADFLTFLSRRGIDLVPLQDLTDMVARSISWIFAIIGEAPSSVGRAAEQLIAGFLTPDSARAAASVGEAATSAQELENRPLGKIE